MKRCDLDKHLRMDIPQSNDNSVLSIGILTQSFNVRGDTILFLRAKVIQSRPPDARRISAIGVHPIDAIPIPISKILSLHRQCLPVATRRVRVYCVLGERSVKHAMVVQIAQLDRPCNGRRHRHQHPRQRCKICCYSSVGMLSSLQLMNVLLVSEVSEASLMALVIERSPRFHVVRSSWYAFLERMSTDSKQRLCNVQPHVHVFRSFDRDPSCSIHTNDDRW